jgi:transposase-like protein
LVKVRAYGRVSGMSTTSNPYRCFRFPAEIINQAVWLYHCFSLSLREVELILAARGVVVSYETIRDWSLRFGRVMPKPSSDAGRNLATSGSWMVCHEHISEGGDVELYKR